jgi:hypothetical protein
MRQGTAAAAFLILLSMSVVAHAADDAVSPVSGSPTAPTQPATIKGDDDASNSIRLTPDASKIIHLDDDAVSVIVANPDHASVVLDSPRLLVVMPRQPGTTLFTVLNAKGDTILEKNVIVSGTVKSQYVRIRRACGAGDSGCAASSYYYCPDGCYEVTPVGEQGSVQAPPVVGGRGGGGGTGEDAGGGAGAPPLPQATTNTPPPVAPPNESGGGPQVPQVLHKEKMPATGVMP